MKWFEKLLNNLVIFIVPSILLGSDLTPEKIIQNMKNALESAKTLSIDFEEKYIWKLTGEENILKGRLIMEGEDRFRVITEDQLIVSDGKTVWTYSVPSNRVLIDQLEKTTETLLPKQIFIHYTEKYDARLLDEEQLFSTDCFVIELTSETGDEYISTVKVWIDQNHWMPKQVQQIDVTGNITYYILHHIEAGKAIEKKMFHFMIPEGAEIIEMR